MTNRQTVELVFISGTDSEAGRLVAEQQADPGGLPLTVGFHAEPGGLPDLLEGRVGLEGFASRTRDRWWGVDAQLRSSAGEDLLEGALARLAADYRSDPIAAARRLFFELTSPLARRCKVRALVEYSDQNLVHAQILHSLLPDARFVSAVRDGREAALALVAQGEVSDPVEGLGVWLQRVRELDVGVHGEEDGEPYELPTDRLDVVVLERTGGPAEVSRVDRLRLERRYSRALQALRREGVHCATSLIVADERSPPSR